MVVQVSVCLNSFMSEEMGLECISSPRVSPTPFPTLSSVTMCVCVLDEVKALLERGGVQEEQLLVDRRLQVNRGKQVKMYRVWIQAKFVRPPAGEVAPPPVPDQHPTNSGAQNYPFTHSLTSDSVDSSVTISVSTCSEHCAPETSSTP